MKQVLTKHVLKQTNVLLNTFFIRRIKQTYSSRFYIYIDINLYLSIYKLNTKDEYYFIND